MVMTKWDRSVESPPRSLVSDIGAVVQTAFARGSHGKPSRSLSLTHAVPVPCGLDHRIYRTVSLSLGFAFGHNTTPHQGYPTYRSICKSCLPSKVTLKICEKDFTVQLYFRSTTQYL
jgi:hypothetical protein